MVTKELYGKIDNKEVYLYTLDNENGLVVKITNYGGIITNIFYKDTDVVLGRDSLEEYLENDDHYGALVGRNSNRLANAQFELNGKTYFLCANDGRNNLHGGEIGFGKKLWEPKVVDNSLVLTLHSPDGEEGFPGNLDVCVTYTITKENSIKIHYEATSDMDTIVNMTNHSYFNLNGHDSGTIDNHTVMTNASFFTPNSDECLPYGEILSVEGRAFDLRKPTKFEDVFNSNDEQVKLFNGFDHNFCLDGRGFRKVASLTGDKTGITMETYTDTPGIQIYCGNAINEDRVCKGGNKYKIHQAVCFETQYFPNAMALSHFPSPILKAGEKYDSTTEYKFI